MNLGSFMDPEYPIFSTTLCYLERDGQYLMLHRVKKQHDENHDKWIGVGGKFEDRESPEDCVCREVLEEIGADVTYTSIPFNELVPAIEANKADIAVSAIDMTRDRADRVNFSNMYYSKESAVILASKDNETIHDPADLAGKTVAVEKGTVYEQTARDYGAEVKAYDYHDATFRAVENKEADALITDMPAAYYYMKHGGEEKLKPAGILAGAGGFVMLLNKKDVQLQSDINQALSKLMSNGEYDKIYDKWFADVNFDSKK